MGSLTLLTAPEPEKRFLLDCSLILFFITYGSASANKIGLT